MSPSQTRTTTQCGRHGHPEFTIQFDSPPVPESAVNWFIRFLEGDVAAGASYKADETLQVGWVICKLLLRSDGTLGVCEPDFKGMPVNWLESVTRTLLHLFIQKSVAESVDLEFQFPTYLNTGIVCTDFYASTGFLLSRDEPSLKNDNDSGWFFGCRNREHDHNSPDSLRLSTLYECAVRKPSIVQYLALPVRTKLVVPDSNNPAEFAITFDGQIIEPKEGSYLARKIQQSDR